MPSEKPVNFREPARRLKLLTLARARTQTVPPLFLTKKLRKTIERLLPMGHHERLRRYFDLYGCLHCSRIAVIYGANGFCRACISMIGKRIQKMLGHVSVRTTQAYTHVSMKQVQKVLDKCHPRNL